MERRPAPEGKIARGWRLALASWTVVRSHPGLLVLPALSVVLTAAAAVILLGPWSLDVIDHHSRTRIAVDAAVCSYPFTFISTYLGVAFYALAAATLDGRRMTTGEALGHARRRIAAVAVWSLVATVVGTLLRSLEHLPLGGLAGRVAEWAGAIAWSLATFFVVPVMALEDVGAARALRRSGAVVRTHWGESVVGTAAIGAATGLVSLALSLVAFAAFVAGRLGFTAGYAVAVVAVLALIAVMAAQTAISQVFRLAVFRHASGDGDTGPFAADDGDAAFRRRTGLVGHE